VEELREEHILAFRAAADRAEQARVSSLDSLRKELTTQHEELQLQMRGEHAAEREDMTRRHSEQVAELTEKQRQEVTLLKGSLSDLESRHALLGEQYEETVKSRQNTEERLRNVSAERDELTQRSSDLGMQLGHANARSERDRELLDRARKAVAIGLGLMEEQKHDPVA
jgi:chromosome segregation ATPase